MKMQMKSSKIASITFTYQKDERTDQINDREKLFEYRQFDDNYQHFMSKLDYNFYIFHNCQKQYAKNIIQKYLKKNQFNFLMNHKYAESFKFILEYLKNIGVTKIVFLQDDVFSIPSHEKDLYTNLYDLIKITNIPYINIEHACHNQELIYEQHKNINLYKTNTFGARDAGHWSFSDASYFANLDYALNYIYDENYFASKDIREAEFYLKHKFDKINLDTTHSNYSFFRRVNIIGPNSKPEYINMINKYVEKNK